MPTVRPTEVPPPPVISLDESVTLDEIASNLREILRRQSVLEEIVREWISRSGVASSSWPPPEHDPELRPTVTFDSSELLERSKGER